MNAVNTPAGWLNTIILRGGPRDGERITISPDIEETGRVVVPGISFARWEEKPSILGPERIDPVYVRRNMWAGEVKTCEFRTWYEWHYMKDS